MRNRNRNKDGWGDGGAPIKMDKEVSTNHGSAAAGGDVGDEEDEPEDGNKPPGQQQVREKKTQRRTGSRKMAVSRTRDGWPGGGVS